MSTPPVSPLPLRLMNMRRCDSVSSSSLSSISSDDGEDLTRNSFHAMVLELMQSIEEKNKNLDKDQFSWEDYQYEYEKDKSIKSLCETRSIILDSLSNEPFEEAHACQMKNIYDRKKCRMKAWTSVNYKGDEIAICNRHLHEAVSTDTKSFCHEHLHEMSCSCPCCR